MQSRSFLEAFCNDRTSAELLLNVCASLVTLSISQPPELLPDFGESTADDATNPLNDMDYGSETFANSNNGAMSNNAALLDSSVVIETQQLSPASVQAGRALASKAGAAASLLASALIGSKPKSGSNKSKARAGKAIGSKHNLKARNWQGESSGQPQTQQQSFVEEEDFNYNGIPIPPWPPVPEKVPRPRQGGAFPVQPPPRLAHTPPPIQGGPAWPTPAPFNWGNNNWNPPNNNNNPNWNNNQPNNNWNQPNNNMNNNQQQPFSVMGWPNWPYPFLPLYPYPGNVGTNQANPGCPPYWPTGRRLKVTVLKP